MRQKNMGISGSTLESESSGIEDEQGEGEEVEQDASSSEDEDDESGDDGVEECFEDEEDSEDDDEDDESSDDENDVIVPQSANQQQVNVEFEAFPPSDNDFQGILALLSRLFFKEQDVNLAELANWIIGHNYIGSVLKTNSGPQDVDTDDEDEDDDDLDDTVYGITSLVSLRKSQKGKEEGFKKSISDFICTKCNSNELKSILEDSTKCVGLLLTERFVNIPPILAPPMLKCLNKEVEDAVKSKKLQNYKFSHVLLISKSYDVSQMQSGNSSKNSNNKSGLPPCLEFVNPEDEIFQQYAQVVASFPVSDAEDLVSGNWGPKEAAMPQYRTVHLMTKEKYEAAVNKISQVFTVENMLSLMNADAAANGAPPTGPTGDASSSAA